MSSISPYGVRNFIQEEATKIAKERIAADEAAAQPTAEEFNRLNEAATAQWLEAQKMRALAPKLNRATRRAGAAQGRSAEFKRLLKKATKDAHAFLAAKAAESQSK